MKCILYTILLLVCSAFFNAQDTKTDKAMRRINKRASLEKALKDPEGTTRLYIKHYKDSVFPNGEILQFKNLVSLSIQGFSVWNFKTDTTIFPMLRIDSTKMRQLPNLRYLSICGFDFSNFPEELFILEQLKGMTLSVCKIKTLPPSISKLTELSYLELRINELVAFPEELTKLETLETLNLCNNKFTIIPPQIAGLKSLNHLDLSNVESDKFIPATPKVPVDININCIDYLANYETLRAILSSEKMRRLSGHIPKNIDHMPLFEKLNNDQILNKAAFCKGPRQ